MKELIKTKTFWSGVGLIGLGIVNIASGNANEGIQNIIEGLAFIFLRHSLLGAKNDY